MVYRSSILSHISTGDDRGTKREFVWGASASIKDLTSMDLTY